MMDPTTKAGVCARYRVLHETRYRYASTVTLSQQYLHLTPRAFAWQELEAHRIGFAPAVDDSHEGVDFFGNATRHVALTLPHDQLLVLRNRRCCCVRVPAWPRSPARCRGNTCAT